MKKLDAATKEIVEDVKFCPKADFVLIEPIPRGETAGGIALPEQAGADEPLKGRVVRVGAGRISDYGVTIDPELTEGEVVYLFFAYAKPIDIVLGRKKYIVARARDVIAGVAE